MKTGIFRDHETPECSIMTVVIDSTCKVGMELFLLQNNKK